MRLDAAATGAGPLGHGPVARSTPRRRLRPSGGRWTVAALACAALAAACTPADAGRGTAAARSASTPATSTAPPATPPASPARAALTPVTLAFGGDVHFEGPDAARLAADPSRALGPVAALLRRADLAMVNLETAVTRRGTPQPKQFLFRAPPTAFTALRAAGIDVVTQANNHGMDYGLVGLRDSIAAARAAHFPVVGIGTDAAAAFAPWRTTVRGTRIAVVGATAVLDGNLVAAWTAGRDKPGLASAKDVPALVHAIRAARAGADLVVVYLHWGTEMASCPTSVQRSLAKAATAAGADVVVGSHAHVLLGAGRMGASYVSYGLGNFVFYASSGPTTASGVLTLTSQGRQVRAASWSPARISGGVPVPLRGSTARAALAQWRGLRGCTGLAAVPAG